MVISILLQDATLVVFDPETTVYLCTIEDTETMRNCDVHRPQKNVVSDGKKQKKLNN